MKHISSFYKMGLNFLPMRFGNSEKESLYRSNYNRKSFHFLIVALLVNIVMFVLLLFSEKNYSHEIRNIFWFVDLVFIALFAVIIFISFAFRSIRKSFFMRFPVFFAAITVILLKLWYISEDPVSFQSNGLEYSSMFFLMVILLYLLSRLRFFWSTILGISITAIYLWLLNNNNLNESLHFPSVLLGLNVIGIFSSYYLEFLSRQRFHMKIEAESNQGTIAGLIDERNEISMEFERMSIDLNKALNIIGKIVEMRDMNTAGHQRKVAKLSVALAEKLDIPSKMLPIISTAALLHDIGKIEIPADILTKPGKLSEPELGIIRRHPEIGYQLLNETQFIPEVAEIILQHHERLDGSGYPYGLKDDEISLEARIIAVADVFDAMTSHRPYRPAFSYKETISEIKSKSGKLYDAAVVEALVELLENGFII